MVYTFNHRQSSLPMTSGSLNGFSWRQGEPSLEPSLMPFHFVFGLGGCFFAIEK